MAGCTFEEAVQNLADSQSNKIFSNNLFLNTSSIDSQIFKHSKTEILIFAEDLNVKSHTSELISSYLSKNLGNIKVLTLNKPDLDYAYKTFGMNARLEVKISGKKFKQDLKKFLGFSEVPYFLIGDKKSYSVELLSKWPYGYKNKKIAIQFRSISSFNSPDFAVNFANFFINSFNNSYC
jgi:hypothetical protein